MKNKEICHAHSEITIIYEMKIRHVFALHSLRAHLNYRTIFCDNRFYLFYSTSAVKFKKYTFEA